MVNFFFHHRNSIAMSALWFIWPAIVIVFPTTRYTSPSHIGACNIQGAKTTSWVEQCERKLYYPPESQVPELAEELGG